MGAAFGLFALGVLSYTLTAAAGVWGDEAAAPWLSMLLIALITLPLALRRVLPNSVAVAVSVAFVVAGEATVPETLITNVALFMALYTVGAWEGDRRRAAWVRGCIYVVMALWLLIAFFRAVTTPLEETGLEGPGIGALTPVAALMLQQVLLNILYFAGSAWFGNHAWAAARQRAISAHRAELLLAEQERRARAAVVGERLRIARELHDAVAHHVSLMGIQAGAARVLLGRDPAGADAQLATLEDSARSAVAELYGLLGTLRDPAEEGEEHADDAAAPVIGLGLAAIPRLIEEASGAGLEVGTEVVGQPRDLPLLTDLNLYRIAQESLTNVLKHAGPGTRVRVQVRHLPEHVELEISDDGRGRRRSASRGAGLGLAGMRERTDAMGGTLEAGRRAEGGFLVRVSVPTAVQEVSR